MTATVVESLQRCDVRICQMQPGDLGVTAEGLVYLRTEKSAICLSNLAASAEGFQNSAQAVQTFVRLLPLGAVVELRVGPPGDAP